MRLGLLARMVGLLCLLLAAAAPAQEIEAPGYAKFPTAGTDLLLSVFRTTYSYPTDAEDLYPVVLMITRQGAPLWSRIATVDPAWPFLSLECKVAWSPDFSFCACSYRTGAAATVVLALDFRGAAVKEQSFAIDDLRDSVLETTHDTAAQGILKAWTEGLEITRDGLVTLHFSAVGAQRHRVTALLDGTTGQLRSWEPVKEAAK